MLAGLARWAIKLQNVVADALSRSFEEAEVCVLELEVSPEIDPNSDAFQSEECRRLRDNVLSTKVSDFQVVDDYMYHRTKFPGNDIGPDDVWKLVPSSGIFKGRGDKKRKRPTIFSVSRYGQMRGAYPKQIFLAKHGSLG